jgi:hypothetical protein
METQSYDAGGATTKELREMRRQQDLGVPARPLFGRLPVARVIPQNLHSVMDYAGAAALIWAGVRADSAAAITTGVALGVADAATSVMTDYRLSVAKIIPIEVHEALDYVVGLGALLAPLWFGKRKGDRKAATTHLLVAASLLVGSLLTDYRAQEGRVWPRTERLLGTQL